MNTVKLYKRQSDGMISVLKINCTQTNDFKQHGTRRKKPYPAEITRQSLRRGWVRNKDGVKK